MKTGWDVRSADTIHITRCGAWHYSLRRTATIERMERGTYPWRMFDPFNLGVPTLRVDTTCGYVPGLDAIIAFCQHGRAGNDVEDEA